MNIEEVVRLTPFIKGMDGKALFNWLPATSKTDLRLQWIVNIKRAGQVPQDKHFSICWQHFTPYCFERDYYNEFQSGLAYEIYKIKDNAVPTIFAQEINTYPCKHRKPRTECCEEEIDSKFGE